MSGAPLRRPGVRGRCVRLALLVLIGLHVSFPAIAAGATQELHGHSDGFATPGVRLAWGVLRGADEAATAIVLRIAGDPAPYARIAIDGVDPFTGQRRPVLADRALAGLPDVRMPRAHFADFPRTELMLRAADDPPGALPRLMIFYQGVPDTTPEFAGAAALDAYLADRIARLRRDAGSATP